MNLSRAAAVAFSLFVTAACGGLTTVASTAPSPIASVPSLVSPSPVSTRLPGPDTPAGLTATQEVITGSVEPLSGATAPCYVERYACNRYRFALRHDGGVDVTLSWNGGSRDMLIQLYRAGAGLVHEDLAPRGSAPQITFRRVDLTAMEYELRVVSMQPAAAMPFTMTVTLWE